MPADYSSTAKALALPISPLGSPSPESHTIRPPWSRRISNQSRRAQVPSPYSLSTRSESYKTQVFRSAAQVQRKVFKTFQALTPIQRVLVVLLAVAVNFGLILFLIYNERIFGFLAPAAKRWHDVRGGWTILWMITFICAFPPVIGYSMSVTIAGFVYGFPKGWFIVSSATVIGSLASFLASRTILSAYVHRLVGADKRFEALALTLKHDGLKILCMIRFCPLPYSLSNAAMSTFPTVHPLSFALATAIASPKLLIHVFIGSRLASIAESDGKMDAGTKAINYASIVFGSILGASVGWIIYRKTMLRAKELESEELESGNRTLDGEVLAGRQRSYSDSAAEEDDGFNGGDAAMMDPDDISLWDNEEEGRGNGYVDFTDEEDEGNDVFAGGDSESAVEGKMPKSS